MKKLCFSIGSVQFKTICFVIGLFAFCHQVRAGNGNDARYFQQDVSYKISVVLNDTLNTLEGDIEITYRNNSSDPLSFIWMHLWPNGYSGRNTALCKQLVESRNTSLFFASEEEKGNIRCDEFKIDGSKVETQTDREFSEMVKLILKEPLQPGASTTISTHFIVKIPSGRISRLGHIGQSYSITQWYPKPAVYDRDGWHPMPYLSQGEFYSEFGSYEVNITLPANYVVAATGILQQDTEKEWMNNLEQETRSHEGSGESPVFPPSETTLKTITFRQDSIHDFAFVADKRFKILTKTFAIGNAGRTVTAKVFFVSDKSGLWKQSLGVVENGMKFLGDEVGEYPYSSFSVVDATISAGGGMEYPMLTVINTPSGEYQHGVTVFHELCHNWFYGILGSNERRYGWLDEGITSYFEAKFASKFLADTRNGSSSTASPLGIASTLVGFDKAGSNSFAELSYKFSASTNSDQPISTTSEDFTMINYATVMYSKTALAFDFLHDYLADPVSRQCFRNYFDKWKFKHPQPNDIREVFEQTSSQDLGWFFDGMLNSSDQIRYKVNKIKTRDGSLQLTMTNCDSIAAPFKVENSSGESEWFNGFTGSSIVTFSHPQGDCLYINKSYHTLLKSRDRCYRPRSLFPSAPGIKLKLFHQITDEPGTETLYLLPVPAWNRYNRWMAGVYITNMDLIPEPFEFHMVPLYDFTNAKVAGLARINHSIWPLAGLFREIKFSVEGRRFAYDENLNADDRKESSHPVLNYNKIAPSLGFTFRKKNPHSMAIPSLQFRHVSIWLDEPEYTPTDIGYTKQIVTTQYDYNEVRFNLMNEKVIDPFEWSLKFEQGKRYMKISTEFDYKFIYGKNKKGIDFRLFAGTFLTSKETERNYNFRMSGWEGSRDYLFDETYFGRSDAQGLWKQQFLIRDGGFKIPTFVGQTNKWLGAVNLIADIPGPLPLKLFFDAGSYEGISNVFDDLNNKVMYDGGIALVVAPDIFEVYLPFIYSDDIRKNLEVNNVKFAEKIRFVLNLNRITPVNIRDRLIRRYQ